MFTDVRLIFDDIPDPRRETKNKLHRFGDILFIVLSALVSGVNDWLAMEVFAEEREAWLRQYISLENGTPSHDTLSRVIGLLKPDVFAECFRRWMNEAMPTLEGLHVAIDGKTLRGSDYGEGMAHIVSAFTSGNQLVLAQQCMNGKESEIKTIPKVLDMLPLAGATVSIDAIGAQKKIVQQITEAKAGYVIGLKENQPTLLRDAEATIEAEIRSKNLPCIEIAEKKHGRDECRRSWLSLLPDNLRERSGWVGLVAVGLVESERTIKGKTSIDKRYFITSLTDNADFSEIVRAHWSIENQQHWVLDVQFREDDNRSRKDYRATNLAVMRRMALNLLRRDPEDKRSITRRKMRACFNDAERTRILFGGHAT
jgi:predicted transposase YbfD/YdcC